jgi:eukaryotic-like serine/threonine-protein kinase
LNKPIPFGKYYLLERINVGGMAEVFKAKTVGVEGFERIVALKRILPSIAEDEEFITMFIDEAKIAVQLQHANIAQIFDLGKVDDSYFIALEYVNGRDVRGIFDDLRKRGERMAMAQVCYFIMQLCEGLDYAHNKRDAQGRELNLVHRDVSPQNVLLGYEGEVKLIDFGIAKAAGKASKTQAGILKGKFGYMSPEQVRGLPIDRRSDIFALGIVLYEMLTGERLFIGESDFSTLEKVRNVEIVPPSSFNAEIPEKLERIVLKTLEKNVEDRYQNAIDLHDDLQLFMHSVGQFASRKDLSAWMKRTFPPEAVESGGEPMDFEEVEEIDEVEAVSEDSAEMSGPATVSAKAGQAGAAAQGQGQGEEEFGWDEEERETQIFDKDPAQLDREARDASFLTEGGDKTVAMAPSEELLAEMGQAFDSQVATQPTAQTVASGGAAAPESGHPGQHKRVRQTQMGLGEMDGDATPLPSPSAFPSFADPALPQASQRRSQILPVANGAGAAARSPFDLPKPTFRQTLIGGPQLAGSLPVSHPAGSPAYPTYQPPQGLPASGFPAPSFAGSPFPGSPVTTQPLQYPPSVDLYGTQQAPVRAPSRAKYYVAFIAFMILGGAAAYMFMTRPGKLQVEVKPLDARLSVDSVVITTEPPFLLEKRPGVYRLSVARPGYVTRDQNVQIAAGQAGHMDIELEPSADTGFDLTSQPSGGLVWLDGQPLAVDDQGKQATTNFHASRIAPGAHVIEIKGNAQYQVWRQEFLQEPGRTVRLHAELVPVGGASKSTLAPKGAAPVPTPTTLPPSPGGALLGSTDKPAEKAADKPADKSKEDKRGGHRGGSKPSAAGHDGDDVFETLKVAPGEKKSKPKPAAHGDDDIFETEGKAEGGGSCVATISSKPWAEVSIDGKPTGKITPLVNFSLPCGKHRITFKNSELMIERNEAVTLKAGQPFKKIFSLVENDL